MTRWPSDQRRKEGDEAREGRREGGRRRGDVYDMYIDRTDEHITHRTEENENRLRSPDVARERERERERERAKNGIVFVLGEV